MTNVATLKPGNAVKAPARARERKPRGRGLRTRTGCMTCRRRHLKCNEIKPVCGHCSRSNQSCLYADPTTQKPASRSTSKSTSASTAASVDLRRRALSPTTSSTGAVEEISLGKGATYTNVPSAPAVWDEYVSTSQCSSPQTEEVSFANTKGPVSPRRRYLQSLMRAGLSGVCSQLRPDNPALASRVASGPLVDTAIAKWFGLLAGDAELDDIAAALSLEERGGNEDCTPVLSVDGPPSPQLVQYGGLFSPGLSDLQQTSPPKPTQAQPVQYSSSSDCHLWRSDFSLSLQPHEFAIFNHFVTRISQWIDLFDPMRQFSTYVPHLAMRNVGLMNAILALSVRHLSLNPVQDSERSYIQNDALPYYHETLHYVQKAMQYDSYNTSDELHATCLIISAYEMLDGSRKDWQRHLQGVFWIQQSQVIHGDSTGVKQAVWWAWLCQDVWAAFRERRKPFTSWRPSKKYAEMNAYEIAARSIYLMAQVVSYCSQEEVEKGKFDVNARILQAETLSMMLDEWQRHTPIEFNPLPLESDSASVFKPIWVNPPAFGVAIQMHCAARILLLLHRPCSRGFGNFAQQQIEISRCIETICGLSSTMSDYASSVMSSQCLFIAGLCMRDPQQREEVVRLLDERQKCSAWPIKSLSGELTRMWNESVHSPRSR